jgi:hypothetical protein
MGELICVFECGSGRNDLPLDEIPHCSNHRTLFEGLLH